ncbi:hypothetical protein MmiHf6_01740 [Methanimicrococcus hongohii]|uniref:Pantoate kinase n=1 Tax=Methanimicrococcus hongohii TaxID=3028295 RepID=A0AA96ZTP2_9EURY|nr:pantoate kinase [Methanimicrococcus sp. Hf6]WNY22882.1 hypothetical protein MmiHf6_01740 [Methanimicrococcus sp. Hf6]
MEFETRSAYSPGHITGFFQICNHADPHQKGSVGAGLVLNNGVSSVVQTFQGEGKTVITFNGIQKAADFSDESANSVLTVISEISKLAEEKYGSAFHFNIDEQSNLPAGSGFGLSAAGAISTAFAAGSSLRIAVPKSEFIEMAHYAEVVSGSGLGDVAGETAGGLAVRENPGGPKFGKYYSVPLSNSELQKKIYCLVLGELSTKSVISDDDCIQRINKAGAAALQSFLKKPGLESFMDESFKFTKDIGLLGKTAEKVIDSIDSADGKAAQAMLGNTVFAIPSNREGADEYIRDLMKKHGDVYECKIGTEKPHVICRHFKSFQL